MPFGAIFINAFREAFHISGHEEGFERVESPRGWAVLKPLEEVMPCADQRS
jgi:hypothetical protein